MFSSDKTPREETNFSVVGTYTRYLFYVVVFQRRCHENIFVIDDACFMPLCQHVQFRFIQHMDIIKHVGLMLKVL